MAGFPVSRLRPSHPATACRQVYRCQVYYRCQGHRSVRARWGHASWLLYNIAALRLAAANDFASNMNGTSLSKKRRWFYQPQSVVAPGFPARQRTGR